MSTPIVISLPSDSVANAKPELSYSKLKKILKEMRPKKERSEKQKAHDKLFIEQNKLRRQHKNEQIEEMKKSNEIEFLIKKKRAENKKKVNNVIIEESANDLDDESDNDYIQKKKKVIEKKASIKNEIEILDKAIAKLSNKGLPPIVNKYREMLDKKMK